MNNLDKQYLELLQDILDNGVRKPNRTGVDTISVFGRQIRHKMGEGFPLLTSKKMPFKTIVTELLWFLSGDTNIKYLVDNGCYIWVGDAYKNYCKSHTSPPSNPGGPLLSDNLISIRPIQYTQEEFINKIKTDDEFAKKWGEMGPIYGKQWRGFSYVDKGDFINTDNLDDPLVGGRGLFYQPNEVDQIQNLIEDLKTNPDSRRLMVNAWNVGELDQMVLPPCHYGFQVYTREMSTDERNEWFQIHLNGNNPLMKSDWKDYELDQQNIPKRAISLMWNQRSVDTPLGLPFNIASYGLLLLMLADEVNMVPDELIGNLGDTHIYVNQIEGVKEQIGRSYTYDERTDMLIEAMGYEKYTKAYNETFPFSGGMNEFFELYKIPERTREPYPLPTVHIRDGIYCSSINDVILENYQSHPKIEFPLSN